MFDPNSWEIGREIAVSTDVLAAGVALLSLGIAIFTFLRTTKTNRRHALRQHTIDVLSMINQDGPVMRSQLAIADWHRTDRVILDDNLSLDDDQAVIAVLDYYDFVSAMALKGDLDVDAIVTLLGGRMLATCERLEAYIQMRRERLGREKLYEPFQTFVATHVVPNRGV
jgi:hypothetical protein